MVPINSFYLFLVAIFVATNVNKMKIVANQINSNTGYTGLKLM